MNGLMTSLMGALQSGHRPPPAPLHCLIAQSLHIHICPHEYTTESIGFSKQIMQSVVSPSLNFIDARFFEDADGGNGRCNVCNKND